MLRSYKYRFHLNSTQSRELDNIFYLCRSLYNSALQERILNFRINWPEKCRHLIIKYFNGNIEISLSDSVKTLEKVLAKFNRKKIKQPVK